MCGPRLHHLATSQFVLLRRKALINGIITEVIS